MKRARRAPARRPRNAGLGVLLRLQARLEAEGFRVTMHLLAPGTTFEAHCPCESRIDVVFSGLLKVVIEGEERLLGPGDWQLVPAGVSMSAEVVGDEPVLGFDAVRD
jgi:quercetin dioxygenase-like cupin family protein